MNTFAKSLARATLVLGIVVLVGGCLPIGARVSNMYTQAPAAAPTAR